MATTAGTSDKRLIPLDAPPLGHIPSFDGFRGVFILVVVLYHAEVMEFLRGAPILIDWFFVSSGFLITSLLLDEANRQGSVSLRSFYTKRVLRLFPAMYAMLAVFSVIAILGVLLLEDPEGLSNWWVDVLGGGLYVYNFIAAVDPEAVTGAIGHIWSLTVEEQFYFVWPLLLAAVLRSATRRADRRLFIGAIAFVALCFFLRGHFQYVVQINGDSVTFIDEDDPTWQGIVYRLAAFRPDMIVYGSLMAILARRVSRPLRGSFRRTMSVVGPLCWACFFAVMLLGNRVSGFELWGGWGYQVGLLAIGPATLDLFFRQDSLFARTFSWEPIRWIGIRTYGIYLWHILPLILVLPLISESYGVQKLVLGLIGSAMGVAAGLASYRYIERRFLSMKDRVDRLGRVRATTTEGSATEGSTTEGSATDGGATDRSTTEGGTAER